MKMRMDEVLTEYADQAFETARLGRNGAHATCDRVFAGVLAKPEACGDAMRFVDTDGRIAWRATPNLCQHLNDLEVDAQDDLDDI
jgi:hypothetical protein